MGPGVCPALWRNCWLLAVGCDPPESALLGVCVCGGGLMLLLLLLHITHLLGQVYTHQARL